MIRSIAYELFDRLTTDPDALRKQVAKAVFERSAAIAELHNCKFAPRSVELVEVYAERDALLLQVRELEATKCKATITSDTIEPTWILALWSIHAEAWVESSRGSYDAMNEKMRANAIPWNLFPRSAWDALVKNGRAR